jgi:hypothetical protein
VANLTQKSNGGFYFSEEVGFEPDVKKNDKKTKGDKKDGKGKSKKDSKQKN